MQRAFMNYKSKTLENNHSFKNNIFSSWNKDEKILFRIYSKFSSNPISEIFIKAYSKTSKGQYTKLFRIEDIYENLKKISLSNLLEDLKYIISKNY